ncbi:helix-turn-helix domain-containing protein [Clostridium sp. UBA1652]|uniref:helix-turn-helix domain-containing protein n=1 Tax=Clostridium sp. UBA1652 TaxID=1946348 RepID=UPI00257CB354|nr:helix-turn-helix domain-containing protein [Clostridium sp. UBA1652]
MNVGIDTIDEGIYNLCSLIHNLVNIDVEFFDSSHNSSLQLFKFQKPLIIEDLRFSSILDMESLLKNKKANDLLYYTDNFNLNYLCLGIFSQQSYSGTIIAGPFLSDIPDDLLISKVIQLNNLPLGYRQELKEFYKSLTILDSKTYKNIGSLMVNLSSNPLINTNISFVQNNTPTVNVESSSELDDRKFYSDIEFRYKLEREIQNSVAKGESSEAIKLMNSFEFNPTHRVPNNPLRAWKNYGFVINTLLRIGADRGGVSPIYIHNISDKFAILIEKVTSKAELDSLLKKMTLEYCELVRNFSTSHYSPIIGKCIDYIKINFYNKISLKTISSEIGISPSHLSRQFKKETKVTITEFINKVKIEEAKFLLKQNELSITDIALKVGFENHNYFCSVFKKLTSCTPKEYLLKA